MIKKILDFYESVGNMEITVEIVRRLIKEQFPQWKELDIRPVAKSGNDNRTFHLGDKMTVRLPSGKAYAAQVAKEIRWLPYLQEHLDYPVSKPIAAGKPTDYYPFPWSVNLWVEGSTLLECSNIDQKLFAKELSEALKKLQAIDCQSGPEAGQHNFYRGGDLKIYHQETVNALKALENRLPVKKLRAIWDTCISEKYKGKDVWVHGDVAPGNILLQNNRFYGMIDFGILGTGDPACDYAMAWTYFDEESRKIFLADLPEDMVHRARGWALWKALITFDDGNEDFRENARYTVGAILRENSESIL